MLWVPLAVWYVTKNRQEGGHKNINAQEHAMHTAANRLDVVVVGTRYDPVL